MTEEDRLAIREACRAFIEGQCPIARTRELMDGGPGPDPAVWKEMAQLGWSGALVPEEYGGSGLDLEFVAIVLEEIGRHLVPSPMASSAVLVTCAILEAGSAEQKTTLLPVLADGSRTATLAASGSSGRPDGSDTQVVAKKRGDHYVLSGSADFVLDLEVADLILVAAREDEAPASFFLVDRDTAGASVSARRVTDLTRRLGRLELQAVEIPDSARLPGSDEGALAGRLTDLAAFTIAADSAGGAQRSLEVAVEYAKNRIQFGRPVGSFQAIKHLLADAYLKSEICAAASRRAARRLTEDATDSVTASLAKSIGADAYLEVAESSIRAHAAVGLTWEYDQHLYLKRARLNQYLYGDSSWHRERMLRSAAAQRSTATETLR